MAQRHCTVGRCGAVTSLVAVIFLVVSLGVPWYFHSYEMKKDQKSCGVVLLFSWQQLFCRQMGECDDPVFSDFLYKCESITTGDWRDSCRDAATKEGISCEHSIDAWNASLGLIALASFLALFLLLGFLVRSCSAWHKGRNIIHAALSVFMILFLTVAIVFFAVGLPPALREDVSPNKCDEGPCHAFYGSEDDKATGVKFIWGPAGWCFAVVAWPIVFAAVVMSFKSDTPYRSLDY